MSRIMFIVQNGIGLGHLRRALLLAKEIENLEGANECFVLAQARSTELFAGQQVPGLTVPSLHTLPNKQMEAAYKAIIEEVIDRSCPSIIVEDTHPLLLLRHVKTLSAVHRVLLIRRMEPLGLEEMRHYGELGWYHLLLYMDSLSTPDLLRFGGPVNALMALSKRFTLVSPIAVKASEEEERDVRVRYRKAGELLIVVTCGGGGDHGDDDSAVRLFLQAQAAAAICLSVNPKQHWVFVTGPYFPHHDFLSSLQVTWVRYEPLLPALLQEADVVIARPGFNVTHEALRGNARLVLIPCQSWHEAQVDWCATLSRYAEVRVVSLGNAKELSEAVSEQPINNPARCIPDGREAATGAIRRLMVAKMEPSSRGIHLILMPEDLKRQSGPIYQATGSADVTNGASILNRESGTETLRPCLWWGSDIGGLNRDLIENIAPCVMLVASQAVSSWHIMASAFGAVGSGVVVSPTTVVSAYELDAKLRLTLDHLRRTPGPLSLVITAHPSEFNAVQDLFRAALIEQDLHEIEQAEFVSAITEQAFLPDQVSIEDLNVTMDESVAPTCSESQVSRRNLDDDIDLLHTTESELRNIIRDLVDYLWTTRKVADLSDFCKNSGKIRIKIDCEVARLNVIR